ncbi:unnamed protein product [Darwinula stevensoni]|uniref:Uncharacterized protein n=1 Tax=Darwinula stevensoni TaxID=69355 RepID=A0A7R9AB94_9CRUS|nr:unnamed protein product [Darwinula stevensoni]CAG0898703.1 unnamed protein product [Darwinula stevensoni]
MYRKEGRELLCTVRKARPLPPSSGLEKNFKVFTSIRTMKEHLLTGLPLNGGKKFQVNFNLKPSEKYLSFANVSHMIFPIFWSAALTKELADEFYNRIILPQEVLAIGSWTAVGVGLLTVVVVGAITVREYRRRGFRPY